MHQCLTRLPQLTLVLVACGAASTHAAWTAQHGYLVKAVDARGEPLAGVSVKLVLVSRHAAPLSTSCTTDDEGRCPIVHYEVQADPNIREFIAHSSTAKAQGSKAGYYPVTGTAEKAEGTRSAKSASPPTAPLPSAPAEIKLRMTRPADYLDDSLVGSPSPAHLREQALKFVDTVHAQRILDGDDLAYKGLGSSTINGKPHLRVMVQSNAIFTMRKPAPADIGRRLFEEPARLLLASLPDALSAAPAHVGYEIVVFGRSRPSFEPGALLTSHELRLLVPEAAARQLRDKAITAQALLDASVVQVDGQRVELRLP